MKAIIHIGFKKTGSTSIQSNLYASRDILLKHGFLYPDLGINQHFGLIPLFKDKPDSYVRCQVKGLDRDSSLAWAKSQEKILDLEMRSSNADTCILSSEDFSDFTREELERFKLFLDERFSSYKILAYVREAKDGYSSVFQQALKGAKNTSIEEIYPWRYKSLNRQKLENFLLVFGINRIEINRFSKDWLIDGDIIQDFIYRCKIPKLVHSTYKNESSSMLAIAAVFLFNKYIPKKNGDNTVNQEWLTLKSKLLKEVANLEEKYSLQPFKIEDIGWLSEIRTLHIEENQWIDSVFFQEHNCFTNGDRHSKSKQEAIFSDLEFEEYILKDLTTPLAFEILVNLAKSIQSSNNQEKKEKLKLKGQRDRLLEVNKRLREENKFLREEGNRLHSESSKTRLEEHEQYSISENTNNDRFNSINSKNAIDIINKIWCSIFQHLSK